MIIIVITELYNFFEQYLGGVMGGFFVLLMMLMVIMAAFKAVHVVPQQTVMIVERLGRYHSTLLPGMNTIVPFMDKIAYRHSLKEIALDVPSQICITKDNTQLQVDGIIYFQVTDPKLASYGSSNYVLAITQLAQTTLRSVIGRLELDKTFEERSHINHSVVSVIDESATTWGVKVLRYEIKDLTPPKEILHSMQAQITAERQKRALIAASEGRRQEQINIASGERESAISRSEGDKQAAINEAQGQAAAIQLIAEANANAIGKIASAIQQPGGLNAINYKIAEQYVHGFSNIAKEGNTVVIPANLSDIGGLITSAMSVMKGVNHGQQLQSMQGFMPSSEEMHHYDKT